MLSTKIRNTIVTLVAFAAVAGTLAPGASALYKIKYIEGHSQAEYCAKQKVTYDNFKTLREHDLAEGNKEAAAQDLQGQQETEAAAKAAGCGWVALISSTSSTTTVSYQPVLALP